MRGVDPEIADEIAIARAAGVDMRRYYRTGVQTYMFILNGCRNVLLRDISIVHSPLWNVRLNDCDRVHVHGVYIYSDLEKGVNADGIDIVSSRNVTISDSIIETADDAIVLKTIARDGQPARPTENVTVTNCVLDLVVDGTDDRNRDRSGHPPRPVQQLRDPQLEQGLRHQRPGRRHRQRRDLPQPDDRDQPATLELVGQRRDVQVRPQEADAGVAPRRHPRHRHRQRHRPPARHEHHRRTRRAADRERAAVRHRHRRCCRRTPRTNGPRRRSASSTCAALRVRDLSVRWASEAAEPKWSSALVLRRATDFAIDGFSGRQGGAAAEYAAIVLDEAETGRSRAHARARLPPSDTRPGPGDEGHTIIGDTHVPAGAAPVTFEKERPCGNSSAIGDRR